MSAVKPRTFLKRASFAGLAAAMTLSTLAWAQDRFPNSGEYGVFTYYENGQVVGQWVLDMCPPDRPAPPSWGERTIDRTYRVESCG